MPDAVGGGGDWFSLPDRSQRRRRGLTASVQVSAGWTTSRRLLDRRQFGGRSRLDRRFLGSRLHDGGAAAQIQINPTAGLLDLVLEECATLVVVWDVLEAEARHIFEQLLLRRRQRGHPLKERKETLDQARIKKSITSFSVGKKILFVT
jgi:hypothetical protein